jgi:cell wall-associated NlpC family hydrolase
MVDVSTAAAYPVRRSAPKTHPLRRQPRSFPGTPPGPAVPAPIRITRKRSHVTVSRGRILPALVCGLTLLLATRAPAQQERARTPVAGDSAAALVRRQLGIRYVFGGTTPERGFDCSGLLQYTMRALGVQLPRTAAEQARAGREIPRDTSQLRPGDLLTFGRGGRVTHVGMYVGGGRFVHASTGSHRITESRLDRPSSSLVRAWYGVRRLFTDSTTTVAATEPAETGAH